MVFSLNFTLMLTFHHTIWPSHKIFCFPNASVTKTCKAAKLDWPQYQPNRACQWFMLSPKAKPYNPFHSPTKPIPVVKIMRKQNINGATACLPVLIQGQSVDERLHIVGFWFLSLLSCSRFHFPRKKISPCVMGYAFLACNILYQNWGWNIICNHKY